MGFISALSSAVNAVLIKESGSVSSFSHVLSEQSAQVLCVPLSSKGLGASPLSATTRAFVPSSFTESILHLIGSSMIFSRSWGISSESNLVPGDGAVLCDPGTLYLYRCCLRVKLSRRKSVKRGYRYCGCKNDRYGSSKLFFHISSLSVRYKASDKIPVCGAKGSPDTKHSIHIIIQFIRVVNQASGKHKIVAIPPVLWYHCS